VCLTIVVVVIKYSIIIVINIIIISSIIIFVVIISTTIILVVIVVVIVIIIIIIIITTIIILFSNCTVVIVCVQAQLENTFPMYVLHTLDNKDVLYLMSSLAFLVARVDRHVLGDQHLHGLVGVLVVIGLAGHVQQCVVSLVRARQVQACVLAAFTLTQRHQALQQAEVACRNPTTHTLAC
jgi:hypothetical protein